MRSVTPRDAKRPRLVCFCVHKDYVQSPRLTDVFECLSASVFLGNTLLPWTQFVTNTVQAKSPSNEYRKRNGYLLFKRRRTGARWKRHLDGDADRHRRRRRLTATYAGDHPSFQCFKKRTVAGM